MWCGVVWCGVVWCGVVWCGVMWCGVVWCGVVWCGVVWCGVVWCGVVWCGVVWCGVVWCGNAGGRMRSMDWGRWIKQHSLPSVYQMWTHAGAQHLRRRLLTHLLTKASSTAPRSETQGTHCIPRPITGSLTKIRRKRGGFGGERGAAHRATTVVAPGSCCSPSPAAEVHCGTQCFLDKKYGVPHYKAGKRC